MSTVEIKKITLPNGDICNLRDDTKQPTLVSGTNIKTINNNSLLGSGNITIDASDVVAENTSGDTSNVQAELDALNSNKVSIGHVTVDLAGVSVTSSDAGWYYGAKSLVGIIPADAMPFAVTIEGSWDASVIYVIAFATAGGGSVQVRSPSSRTLGNDRKVKVFYYQ